MCPQANDDTIHISQFETRCVTAKVQSKSSNGVYTYSDTRAIQNIFNKMKICRNRNIPCKYTGFHKDFMEKVLGYMIC